MTKKTVVVKSHKFKGRDIVHHSDKTFAAFPSNLSEKGSRDFESLKAAQNYINSKIN